MAISMVGAMAVAMALAVPCASAAFLYLPPEEESRNTTHVARAGSDIGSTVAGRPAGRWSRSAVARLGRSALDGRLRLRVVPVAVLGAESAREAAAIASDNDPALAWFEGTGAQAGPEGGRLIAGNNALYDRWGVDAVPLIVWRGADGHIAQHLGDIDDPGAWLEALPHE